jgi:hypothetical protein
MLSVVQAAFSRHVAMESMIHKLRPVMLAPKTACCQMLNAVLVACYRGVVMVYMIPTQSSVMMAMLETRWIPTPPADLVASCRIAVMVLSMVMKNATQAIRTETMETHLVVAVVYFPDVVTESSTAREVRNAMRVMLAT